jgi:hypothetical protein
MAIQTNQASQVDDGENLSDARIILLLSIPFGILTIVFIVVLILMIKHYRKTPI